jgi:AcrR family transcriptional regulator
MVRGLRERKKGAVRYALSSAAIRLAVERGLGNVTIEDITAEADVSVRTFGNYFSSKYEAICAIGTDRARRIGAELLARPADEPLWEAIVHAMLAHYEGADQAPDREWLAALKLVLTAPAIRGEYLKVNSEMQQALAEAIAARTGMDARLDMYPQVLAGAVTAAAHVAVRRWGAADPPVPLRPLLRSALDQLATACSGAAARYLTEEEFQALVRPTIFGPNGPLCQPPVNGDRLSEAALINTVEASGAFAWLRVACPAPRGALGSAWRAWLAPRGVLGWLRVACLGPRRVLGWLCVAAWVRVACLVGSASRRTSGVAPGAIPAALYAPLTSPAPGWNQ